MKVGAVIVCAGQGRRLGQPKAGFLLEGKPLFYYSIKVFLKIAQIKQIVLVLQKKHFKLAERFIKDQKIFLAEGGALRSQSVANGLAKIREELDYVLIHDCARTFINKKIVKSIIDNLKIYPAVIPGLKITDTLKEVRTEKVKKTLKRDSIFSIQTPQGFRKDLIKKAYNNKKRSKVTDSAQLMEKIGQKIKVVEGLRFNFKVTYPQDIQLARKLWKIIERD